MSDNIVKFDPSARKPKDDQEFEDEMYWTCACDNQLYYVTPSGIICSSCRVATTFTEIAETL